MKGKAGNHKIIVCIDDNEIDESFQVNEKPSNSLDGGFVLLSGAENITCMQPYSWKFQGW